TDGRTDEHRGEQCLVDRLREASSLRVSFHQAHGRLNGKSSHGGTADTRGGRRGGGQIQNTCRDSRQGWMSGDRRMRKRGDEASKRTIERAKQIRQQKKLVPLKQQLFHPRSRRVAAAAVGAGGGHIGVATSGSHTALASSHY
ncbi:unnamed protein product, partial [Ectocarpus sp. 4 AP-2014]